MGSKINFGGRIFPAKGEGKLYKDAPTQVGKAWASIGFGSNPVVITFNSVIGVVINLNTVYSKVLLTDLYVKCIFIDVSTGVWYNVSELVTSYPGVTNCVNTRNEIRFSNAQKNDIGMVLSTDQVGANSTLNWFTEINGGDVFTLTGVTPVAPDSFQFYLNIGYYPI